MIIISHVLGKSVLEYPTLVVSTASNLLFVNRAIATTPKNISVESNEADDVANKTAFDLLKDYGDEEDGEQDLACNVSNKRRRSDTVDSTHVEKSVRVAARGDSNTEDDVDETNEEGADEFLSALQEFGTADPAALKAYIEAEEGIMKV